LYIKYVELQNYRNYESVKIDLNKNINIFVGNNAQGKTNMLEAIFVCAFGKSFRTNREKELIRFDRDYFSIKSVIQKENREMDIRIIQSKDNKKGIKVNGIGLKKTSQLIGKINVVLFSPEDLRLITEGPAERRKFLDRELSHMSTSYCMKLIEYNKVLSSRNKILKSLRFENKFKDTLEIWDDKLVKLGYDLIKKRLEFIERLNIISQKNHKKITSGKEEISIRYLSNINTENIDKYDKIYMEFKSKLSERLENDIAKGFTSVGPHRDDFEIMINDIDVRKFGSQGQKRSVALSIKLSEIDIIREETGEYPVLLLDDVMSELDYNRQNQIVKEFEHVQTVITTTEISGILKESLKDASVFSIHDGKVI
jgi:DNA replication and repair protein RecF